MVIRYFRRKLSRDKSIFRRGRRHLMHRRRIGIESLESRAMLATVAFDLFSDRSPYNESVSGAVIRTEDWGGGNSVRYWTQQYSYSSASITYTFSFPTSVASASLVAPLDTPYPGFTGYGYLDVRSGNNSWTTVDSSVSQYNGKTSAGYTPIDISSYVNGGTSISVRARLTNSGPVGGQFLRSASWDTTPAFRLTVTEHNVTPTDVTLSGNSVAENSGIDAFVGKLSTADLNSGETFTYTLVAGTGSTDNALFNISGNELRANASFDFESKNSYSVRVRSTDQGGLSTEKTFAISVANVNEAPTHLALSATSIAENGGVNAVVGTLSTTDPDASNTFTYALVSGTGDSDNAAFNISGNQLRANAGLDFETKSSYSLRVRSTDQGGLSTEKSFTINVTDIGGSLSPVLVRDSHPADSVWARVGTLAPTEPLASSRYSYSLVSGLGADHNGLFSINGNSLFLSAWGVQPNTPYSIRVRITDQAGAFTETVLPVTFSANQSAAMSRVLSLGDVVAGRDGFGNAITGLSGIDGIDPSTGLFRSTPSSHVYDAGFRSVTSVSSIDGAFVMKANSAATTINSAGVTFTPLTTDGQGVAYDNITHNREPGTNAAMMLNGVTFANGVGINASAGITFDLRRILQRNGTPNRFTASFGKMNGVGAVRGYVIFSDDSRVISQHVTRVVNDSAESAEAIDLAIPAGATYLTLATGAVGAITNDHAVFGGASISVSQANTAPTDIALSPSAIAENTGANAVAGTLTTTDPDAGDTFTYTLVSGTGSTDNASFNISGNQLRANASFDFETKSSYSIRVRSTDQGGLSVEKTFAIAVVDLTAEPPYISSAPTTLTAGSIVTIRGSGFSSATAVEFFRYTSGFTADFQVQSDSVIIASIPSMTGISTSGIYARVRSADGLGVTMPASFTDVTALNTSGARYSSYRVRNGGSVVGDLRYSTVLIDSGGAVSGDASYGTIYIENGGNFTATAANTNNYMNVFVKAGGTYAEGTQTYNTVYYEPGANIARSTGNGSVFIEVPQLAFCVPANAPPTNILLSASSFGENKPIGTVVANLTTTDANAGDTFTYTLVSGTGSTDNAAFSVVGGQLLAQATFDRETKSSYSIRIRTTDLAGLWYERSVSLTISDVNEAAKAVGLTNTTYVLPENTDTTTRTKVADIVVSDDALGVNTFALTGADAGYFEVVGTALYLKAGVALDASAKPSYEITVTTSDATLPGSQSVSTGYTLSISKIAITASSVLENSAAGTAVGILSTVGDGSTNSAAYSLVDGAGDTDNASFEIVDGVLRTRTAFDAEAKGSYLVRIRSVMPGGPTVEQSFTIVAVSINESPTDLVLSNQFVVENVAGATVGAFSTIDPDTGDAFTYTLVSGTGSTDNASFSIVGTQLRTVGLFNYEAKSSYSIRVRATDAGGLYTEKAFTIGVLDANDVPTFISLSRSIFAENQPIGTVVATLTTTDVDVGQTFTYALVSGTGSNNNASFSVSGNQLLSQASFDKETKSSYSIRLRTTDSGGQSYERSVIITISDVNEAPTDIFLTGQSVAENSPLATAVGTFSAIDPDTNSTFTYSLVSGSGSTDNANFNISGNKLVTAASVDFETQSTHSVRVRATDAGGLSVEKVFVISVTDVTDEVTLSGTSVAENSSTGTSVGQLAVANAAAGTTFTYALVAGVGSTDNASFAISGNALTTASVFNYETKSLYAIRVRATGSDGSSRETAFTISVTDVYEAPPQITTTPLTGSAGATVSIGGSGFATATSVVFFDYGGRSGSATFTVNSDSTITATVPSGLTTPWLIRIVSQNGVGVTIPSTYTQITTATQSVSGSNFFVVKNGGSMPGSGGGTVVIESGGVCNNSGAGSMTVFVKSGGSYTQGGGGSNTIYYEPGAVISQGTNSSNIFIPVAAITASSLSNYAPTNIGLTSTSVAENAAVGTVVGTLSTTDPDAGNTFTYELVAGTGATDNGSFAIVGNQLQTAASFNFESKSSYSIRIRSTDQGGLPYESTFTITITNVNETPTNLALSGATVAENQPSGTVIGTLSATDPDASNTFTYSLVSGEGSTDNASFSIVGNSLRTAGSFNFENKSSYSIRVRVTDQGGLTLEKIFVIGVTDLNESPTDLSLSSFTVAENQPVGAVVGTLTTTDQDVGGTYTYTLVSGTGSTDNASFQIVGSQLRTAAAFDFETKSSYSVRVRTTDQGGLFVEKALTIAVTNVNESPTNLVLSASAIAENVAIGSAVGTFSTTDPDAGSAFTYTLVSGDGDADNASFGIVGNQLRTAASFNYESRAAYTLRVRATDQDGLTAEKSFTIDVTNVNEAPDNLSLSSTTVAENQPAGTVVANLSSADADVGDAFTYALVSGDGDADNALFSIVGSELQTGTVFNFEARSNYSIRIRSTDQGGLSTEKSFTITVADVAETPSDLVLSATAIADRQPVGTPVGSFTTIDQDGSGAFTYALVSGEGDADNGSFSIVGNELRAAETFAYAVKNSYTIRVRSTDQSNLSVEKVFTIAITLTYVNEAPTDIGLSAANVAENQPAGTVVGVLSSTDADAANTFTYTLVSGDGDADNAFFTVLGTQLRTASTFNYEAKSSYSVRIRSTDQGGLFTEKTYVISVTDGNDRPTNIGLSGASVAENAAVGTTVGTLSTTDVDAGDTFTYTLVSGDGDADNASFQIVGGVLKTNASFDYETKSSYSVRVRSTDADGLFTEKVFAISVTNVNEAPTGLVLNGTTTTLPENTDTSSRIKVADIVVTDDALRTNALTLSGADSASFEIDGTALYLKAGTSLNYEAKASFAVTVNVADATVDGSTAVTAEYTLSVTNVNEGPSDIGLTGGSVTENAAVGTVGTLSTTDVDAGDTFTYTLVTGDGDTDNASFQIVGGVLQTNASFDYETKSSYSVRVRSTDADGLLTEKAFAISVTNVNEAPTGLALTGVTSSIAENADTSSRIKVADIVVTDDALGTNALTLSGADSASFEIDGTALYLKAGTSLNYEAKTSFAVTVNVADVTVDGSTAVTADYILSLTNVNEGPTDIGLSGASVAENLPSGTTVGTLSTFDVDAGDTFTYTLVSGDGGTDNASFQIVGGVLQTNASFDYETKSSYSVRVQSTDADGLFTEKAFTISVTNVNERPTNISLSNASVAENAAAGTTVGTLSTTDADSGDTFAYSLVSGSGDADNAAFTVVGGQLRTAASFNFEVKGSYAVRVRAVDQGGLATEKALTITVSDVDEAPVAIALPTTTVAENLPAGAVVGTLATTDPDTGDTFTYSLVSGAGAADNASFQIVGSQLRTASAFNFEAKSSYSIRIRSTDARGLFVERALSITVSDVTEPMVISGRTVAENAPVGTLVGSLTRTDAVVDGTPLTIFYIPATGEMILRNTTGSALAIQSVTLTSPGQKLNQAQAAVPSAAFVTSNYSDGATYGQYSEIFFAQIGTTALTLAPNASWNFGPVAEAGLTKSQLEGSFSTDPEVDFLPGSSAGQFLYSLIENGIGSDPVRGKIAYGYKQYSYSLVSGDGDADNSLFAIDAGGLRTNAVLDFEARNSYSVRVRSTDNDGNYTEDAFTVSVTNVNDAPTDVALSATTVAENQPTGTTVGTLSSVDQDAGDTFTYTLVSGDGDTDNASFQIVGGVLKTNASFDYEAKSSYSVRVRSTDANGLFTEKAFTISVTNVNEGPTDIGLSGATVAENAAAGTTVGTLSTSDVDAGDTFTYTLVSGDGDTDNASFQIVGGVLQTDASFDYETKSSYSVRVRSTDAGGLFTEKAFTISVTNVNEAPTGLALTGVTSSIAENADTSSRIKVADIVITDDALGTNTLTLSGADAASFEIDGTALYLKAGTSLNYEAKTSFAVTVNVADATVDGSTAVTAEYTLSVTNVNEGPTDIGLTGASVAENAAAGTTVGTLSTFDVDAGDTFTYTLVSGDGGTDNASFQIVGGVLKTNASFDYEAKSSYSVRVWSTDAGGLFTEKAFTISVTNANEGPTDIGLSASSVAENAAVGTAVGTLSTTDVDASDTFTYTLVTGDGDTDNASFQIVGGVLQTNASFDYETKSSYSVRVRSTDADGLFTEKAFTLSVTNVNEGPSDIGLTGGSVTENAAVGTVGTLSTTDVDAGDTFTYTLVSGDGDADNASFQIVDGVLQTNASFDYETKNSYSVRVRSTDANGLFTEKAFTISVTNVNEAPTGLALTGVTSSIVENVDTSSRIKVADIVVTDDALGTNALTLSGADAASFEIDGTALYLKAGTSLNYEAKTSFAVTVNVADVTVDGSTAVTADYILSLTNVNEGPTDIGLSGASVAENLPSGTTVGTLSTTDVDAGDTFTYTLVSGDGDTDNASFQIVGGVLQTNASFDYETKSSYSVRVRSTDANGLFTEKAFTISVTNVNEGPTEIGLTGGSVAENAAVGTAVGTLSTSDVDAGDTFAYTLVMGDGNTDNASFQIVGGVLQTNASFDYETKSSYSVRVRSTDANGLFTERAFTISVTNVNEAPTGLALTGVTSSITENADTSSRIKVADIVVTDDALGTNALTLSGADAASFEIDGTALYLKAGTSLNYEAKTSFAVTVNVADVTVDGSTAVTAEYTLSVTNVNDGPTDIGLSGASIAENAAAGTTVGTLSTTDVDAGDTFTYSLVAGSGDADNAAFQIVGGVLKTAASFDYETKNSYSVRIRSTDANGLFTEKAFTISVTNANEGPTDIGLSGASVVENAAAGTTVGTLSTTDVDAGDTFTYTFVTGDGDTDNASFQIVGGVLQTNASFDYETKSSYSVRVRSTDADGLFTEMAFTISVTNVNEGPTDIGLSGVSVVENAAAGTAVGTLSTTDEDDGGPFTYSLVSGTGSTDNASFALFGNQLRTAASFNYEAQSSYSVRIRSTDAGGLSTEKVFTISVINVNEAPTGVAFANALATLPESTSTQSRVKVADLVVADDGLGTNVFTVSGADSGLFEVVGSGLYLKQGTTLDYGVKSSYDVTVSVLDTTAFNSLAPTPVTLYYSGSTGNLQLRNTTSSTLSLEQVWIVSPTQSLSGAVATVPTAAFTTLNTDALGLYGLSSEIFFANVGAAVLTLTPGATWNLGNVIGNGLSTAELFAKFATEADTDPEGVSGGGRFLYGLVDPGDGPSLVRGSIVNEVTNSFSMKLANVPTFSGREYVEVSAGQTVIDNQARSGARQVIVRGGGRMILTGANTHSGGTRVEAGELVIQNTAALGSGGLDVQSGAKVFVDVGYGRVAVSQLSLAPTARIDLGRGGLSIAAGGGTVSSVRQLLASARNGGQWDGFGIGSTNAKAASNTAIGYRQQSLTSPIIVAWAAYGDVNLSGRVDSADITVINSAKSYLKTDRTYHWYEGDFSYDGKVNSTDINFLNRWFNKGFYNTVIYAAAFSSTTSSTSSTSKTSTLFVTSFTNNDLISD